MAGPTHLLRPLTHTRLHPLSSLALCGAPSPLPRLPVPCVLQFEQLVRVHTLLALDSPSAGGGGGTDGTDESALADHTLVILLCGCDMSSEHGGIRESGFYRHRWQAAPTTFGPLDGPGSSFRRWLKTLFSSLEPVCLGQLPSGVGFRRLHVGDVHLDHFTSLGAKPNQYDAFVRRVTDATRRPCLATGRAASLAAAGTSTAAEGGGRATGDEDDDASWRAARGSALPLVLALGKPEGRRRPLGLEAAVAHLRTRLEGSARVVLLGHMDESMPACEQLRWLQSADVLLTPAGGISVAAAFLRPGTSVISFGVPAPNHQKAVGAWDYDLVRLQVGAAQARQITSSPVASPYVSPPSSTHSCPTQTIATQPSTRTLLNPYACEVANERRLCVCALAGLGQRGAQNLRGATSRTRRRRRRLQVDSPAEHYR